MIDNDDIQFSADECCCLCGNPFYYVQRSAPSSDICDDCESGMVASDYIEYDEYFDDDF